LLTRVSGSIVVCITFFTTGVVVLSLRNFDFKWNFEPLPLNAVETLRGTINDGVAFSLAIRIDAAEHDGRLAVSL
jgi:hypothetical protein